VEKKEEKNEEKEEEEEEEEKKKKCELKGLMSQDALQNVCTGYTNTHHASPSAATSDHLHKGNHIFSLLSRPNSILGKTSNKVTTKWLE